MNWKRRLLWAATPAVFAASAVAADKDLTADQMKQVVRVESITIPMPGEFFAAIDKQGRPNWTQLVHTGTPKATASRPQIALILGTLVADGYIAVEATDNQSVKNIGKEIINLAKKLNVSQSVLGRGNSINDFADGNEWNALREELEATQNEVKLSMEEQKDKSLVILVTLGAWIRGTDIVSGLVDTTYTPESARLLHQPAIIEYLLSQIELLPKNIKEDPMVVQVKDTLQASLANVSEETPSAQNVKDLHKAMSNLLDQINKGSKP